MGKGRRGERKGKIGMGGEVDEGVMKTGQQGFVQNSWFLCWREKEVEVFGWVGDRGLGGIRKEQ